MSKAPGAEEYVHYYRDILRRIAKGWDTPQSLAKAALDWELHAPDCGSLKREQDVCDCGAAVPSDASSKTAYAWHDNLPASKEPV